MKRAMIPGTHVLRQMPAWQEELSRAVTDPAELLQILRLATVLLPAARAAARVFPLRVPRGYIARMRPGDPADPLLRQVLPLGAELEPVAGFGPDPVGDLAAVAARGVLHKYRGRVLLIATGACAVNCRFCFRRHFPYGEAAAATDRWREALAYIAADDSIAEVILSGGDPPMLPHPPAGGGRGAPPPRRGGCPARGGAPGGRRPPDARGPAPGRIRPRARRHFP